MKVITKIIAMPLFLFPFVVLIVAYMNQPRTAWVGDSWAILCPADGPKYTVNGGSIKAIRKLVKNTHRRRHETVIIIAGIAELHHRLGDNLMQDPKLDAEIESVQRDLLPLAELCQRKFRAKYVIVYNPAAMVEYLKDPKMRRDDLHLKPEAYPSFLLSHNSMASVNRN